MIRHLTAIAALVIFATPAVATPSECKGLAESACGANAICKWMPARVAGEKSPRTGKTYAQSAKAHCRKGNATAKKGG